VFLHVRVPSCLCAAVDPSRRLLPLTVAAMRNFRAGLKAVVVHQVDICTGDCSIAVWRSGRRGNWILCVLVVCFLVPKETKCNLKPGWAGWVVGWLYPSPISPNTHHTWTHTHTHTHTRHAATYGSHKFSYRLAGFLDNPGNTLLCSTLCNFCGFLQHRVRPEWCTVRHALLQVHSV